TLSRSGKITLEASPIHSLQGNKITLAKQPMPRPSTFIYHKTTHRQIYRQHLEAQPEFNDVILWNDQGFITESCIANVVISHQGEWVTPPLNHGLLPGVFRKSLIENGLIHEKSISVDELLHAQHVYLINSVRG